MKIGIDSGISTTKIVGIDDAGNIISPTRVKGETPLSSIHGALSMFMSGNHLLLTDIDKVMLTGVGAEYVKGDISGIPTMHVPEFRADAIGARVCSGLSRMITVSMGTGTTILHVDGDKVQHLGGLGMGGGTLTGLARLLLGTDDIQRITQLASGGDLSNVNLKIGDISVNPLPGLPLDTTASLFGKVPYNASKEDIALGLIWTVIQTICSGAVLAGHSTGTKDFVMIGTLTLLPQSRAIFDSFESLYGVRIIIPEHSAFCTAIGCAGEQIRE